MLPYSFMHSGKAAIGKPKTGQHPLQPLVLHSDRPLSALCSALGSPQSEQNHAQLEFKEV